MTFQPAGKSELRKFGLTTGVVVVALFGLAVPWLAQRPWPAWPFGLGAGLMLAGLLAPGALQPVHWLWMGFGRIMGALNTRIVLSILFYFVFVPTGLAMRLLRYDPLALRRRRDAATYRVQAVNRPGTHMEHPF